MDPRTRTLLEAPILPTLLRLAIPNLVMTGNLTHVFLMLGLALAAFGTMIALAVKSGAWFRGMNDSQGASR